MLRKEISIVFFFLFIVAGICRGDQNPGDIDSLFKPYTVQAKNEVVYLKVFFIRPSAKEDMRKTLEADISSGGYSEFSKAYPGREKQLRDHVFVYKTKFFVTENLSLERLSLYVGMMDAPRIIFLNNIEIGAVGIDSDDPLIQNPHGYESSQVDLARDLLHYGNIPNELAVVLYMPHHFEPIRDIAVGAYPEISGILFLRNFIALHVPQAMFFLSITIFLYFLFLFMLRNFKDKTYLYFGMVCICFALSYVNLTFANDSIGQYVTEIVSRCSFPFCLLFLTFFVMEFTGVLDKNRPLKIIMGLGAIVLSSITALQRTQAGVASVFGVTMLLYIAPLLFFNLGLLVVSIVKKKNHKSIIVFATFVLIVSMSIHDIYFVFNSDVPYTYMLQFGFLGMIISVFFILAFDQSRIHMRSIEQADTLNERNKSLDGIIKNIAVVVNNFGTSYSKLINILSGSSEAMKKYETNTNQIMTSISGRFSDVEEIIKKISLRIEESADKVPKAVTNQTTIVRNISTTLGSMVSRLEESLVKTNESAEVAKKLADLASASTTIIGQSKKSMETLKDHSKFLKDVLAAIEDIGEKTNILSINAAIEAAREGVHGKGFAIIANEIRGLSSQSRGTVAESFEKIKSMFSIVDESTGLSDAVSKSLAIIIDKIGATIVIIDNITKLMHGQRANSKQIVSEVENLLRDTLMIEWLTGEEQKENKNIKTHLGGLKDMFIAVNDALKEQSDSGAELLNYMEKIHEIVNENLETMMILKDCIR